MSAIIRCPRCRGTRFCVRSGFTRCLDCGQRSEEHGQETELEDEALNALSSKLTKKKLASTGKRKRARSFLHESQRHRPPLVSFNHAEMYAYVFKAWVDEAVDLGCDEDVLKAISTALWARYMGRLKVAFTPKGMDPVLPPKPSMRDLQSKLFKRKMILSKKTVKTIYKSQWRQKKVRAEVDCDGMDEDELKITQRRRRRKAIRALFSSGNEDSSEHTSSEDSDVSMESELSDVSRRSSASFGEFVDDDQHSFSEPPSPAASQHSSFQSDTAFSPWDEGEASRDSFDSSFSRTSSVSSAWDDALSETIEEAQLKKARDRAAEKEAHAEVNHAHVVRNVISQRKRRAKDVEKISEKDARNLNKRNVFACFALATLCCKDSRLTLADLIWLASTGAVSYDTATKNVPPALKLRTLADHNRVQDNLNSPVDQVWLKSAIFRLGCFLDLKMVNFDAHDNLRNTVERYVREFSLPKCVTGAVLDSLAACPEALDLKQYFTEDNPSSQNNFGLLGADIRALAVILMALKYVFVLDDWSEEVHSAAASRLNRELNEGEQPAFVFSEWFQFSRERLFQAVRHHHVLNKKFTHIFEGRVRLTPEAEVEAVRYEADVLREQTANIDENITLDSKLCKQIGQALSDELDLNQYERTTRVGPDLKCSLTPLHDFALHHADQMVQGGDGPTEGQLAMAKLLDMHNHRLGFNFPGSSKFDLPWRKGHLASTKNRKMEREEEDVYIETRKPEVTENGLAECIYWRVSTRGGIENLFERQSGDRENHMMREQIIKDLPETFSWLLRYFAAHAGLSPVDLLLELQAVERAVAAKDVKFLGKNLKKRKPKKKKKSTVDKRRQLLEEALKAKEAVKKMDQ